MYLERSASVLRFVAPSVSRDIIQHEHRRESLNEVRRTAERSGGLLWMLKGRKSNYSIVKLHGGVFLIESVPQVYLKTWN